MNVLVIVQTNITCIALLIIIEFQMRKGLISNSSANKLLNYMMTALILMCISDTAFGLINGKDFSGARILIEVFNGMYYELICLISFLWLLYVMVKMELLDNLRSKMTLIGSVPLVFMTIVILLNHYNRSLFYVDSNNYYIRCDDTCIHWIMCGIYPVLTVFILIGKLHAEKNYFKRREILLLLSFIVAPSIASIAQILVPGTSYAQVGMVISMLIIYLSKQNNQIMRDELTGLNNKRAYIHYVYDKFYKDERIETVTIIMIDVDDFKSINDTYGHMVGDRALKFVAEVLKKTCGAIGKPLFLCRYAGDEFLITATGVSEGDIIRLKEAINSQLDNFTSVELPRAIKLSIGSATAICRNHTDVDALINAADDSMYEIKRDKKIR